MTGYATALSRFESGDLAGTEEALKELLMLPYTYADGASLRLAAQVESLRRAGTEKYIPVVELTSK